MKKIIYAFFLLSIGFSLPLSAQIPSKTLIEIVRAEDELRFDKTLENLLKSGDAAVRKRAALAVGRTGNDAAVPALAALLENDRNENVRAMAAFAIGEIESIKGAEAILKVLSNSKNNPNVRARAIETAGKIAAANGREEKSKELGKAILENLEFEHRKRSGPYKEVIEYGLTAVLRARPENAEKTLVQYIEAYTPEIRANALNALARLRAKNANEQARNLLQTDADAIVRANSARVLGAAEDKDAFDLLLNAATDDKDSRVRVSAIRSLGSLKDAKAADRLLERGEKLLADCKKSKFANPVEKSELLEIATALGRILPKTNNERAIKFLDAFRYEDSYQSPETEIAFAQIAPSAYLKAVPRDNPKDTEIWRQLSSASQGMAEFAKLDDKGNSLDSKEKPQEILGVFLKVTNSPPNTLKGALALPDMLRAYAGFKSDDLSQILRDYLKHKDLFVRATAAELLGEQPATKENVQALKIAFAASLKTDKNYDDAQLAILSALVKLDKTEATEYLRLALDAPNFLVRRRAADLIKQNDLQKDFLGFEQKVGTVKPYNAKTGTKLGQILNTEADYRRAVSRKSARAILATEKGTFTIEFLPQDAPLTVDNFIKLAKSGYFNGLAVHRVVPNFVMQDGDPRGDGNGGPGWNIRDEMNMVPYERGAVGMALSGKDTGGSQWFVTHSPQPHLDGGYTVFGRVNETDMKVVDKIVRGDKILNVKIIEDVLNKNQKKN